MKTFRKMILTWSTFVLYILSREWMVASETTSLWQGEELLPVTTPVTQPTAALADPACCKVNNSRDATKADQKNIAGGPIIRRVSSTNSLKPENMTDLIDTLSHQVRILLRHFQGPDPVGLPGLNILQEPLIASDTNASFGIATGLFSNITIWGLSNFSISVIQTNLDDMEANVVLRIRTVLIKGNYSVSNFLIKNEGPFNITLTNVTATGTIDLATNDEGRIFANNSVIDMDYEKIEVVLSSPSTILYPFINSAGASLLNSKKQPILENINQRLLSEIDRRLAAFPSIPPLSHMSPVDLAILEARKFIRLYYDPYVISKVIDFKNAFIMVHVGPISVKGVSKFARVGNVTLAMANETVTIRLRIVTGRLSGNCKWLYDFGATGLKRYGESNFTIQHLQFEAKINQSIDSRKPPLLDDLQIETGPIVVKMDGKGNFDYLVEIVVKLLPKMLRYTIIDALEEPLKQKIQSEIFDLISVDRVVEEKFSDIKKYLIEKLSQN